MKLFSENDAIVYFPSNWNVWKCVYWMADHEFSRYGFNPKQTAFDNHLNVAWNPDGHELTWQFNLGLWINDHDKQKNTILIPPELKQVKPKDIINKKVIAYE